MAIFGGLLRSSMCKWTEGMALKNEHPGISNVCMIIGLRLFSACGLMRGLHAEGGTYTVRLLPSSTTQTEPQTSCTTDMAKMAQTTMGP